jgi:CubicO group peptidase (beta-lactamase class C family)
VLAKLVYDGKVDLNEPIKNILPVHLRQGSLNGSEITLVHLANHTSLLPFEPSNVKDDKESPSDPYYPTEGLCRGLYDPLPFASKRKQGNWLHVCPKWQRNPSKSRTSVAAA